MQMQPTDSSPSRLREMPPLLDREMRWDAAMPLASYRAHGTQIGSLASASAFSTAHGLITTPRHQLQHDQVASEVPVAIVNAHGMPIGQWSLRPSPVRNPLEHADALVVRSALAVRSAHRVQDSPAGSELPPLMDCELSL